MKKLLVLTVLMLLPLIGQSGNDSWIYGPEAFARTSGAPDTYDDSFSASAGSGYLIVFNGDDEQDSRVSSATIVLNGAQIIGSNDLNQNVDRITRGVNLQGNNSLQITIDGAPGSYITVLILTDSKKIPEFTAGRIQLAWTSVGDPNVAVRLRLKNGSPAHHRCYRVRFYNEDGSLAAITDRMQLEPHASLNTALLSLLPAGAAWQTGSVEIVFAGRGGGRILGFGTESNSSNQTETSVPLQWGGLRHYLRAKK